MITQVDPIAMHHDASFSILSSWCGVLVNIGTFCQNSLWYMFDRPKLTAPNGNTTIVAYEKVNDPLAKWQQCAFGHKRALETMKIFSYAALHPKSSLRDEKTFDVIFIPLKRATSWSTSLRLVIKSINIGPPGAVAFPIFHEGKRQENTSTDLLHLDPLTQLQ